MNTPIPSDGVGLREDMAGSSVAMSGGSSRVPATKSDNHQILGKEER